MDKGAKERQVPFSHEMRKILFRWLSKSKAESCQHYLFTSRNGNRMLDVRLSSRGRIQQRFHSSLAIWHRHEYRVRRSWRWRRHWDCGNAAESVATFDRDTSNSHSENRRGACLLLSSLPVVNTHSFVSDHCEGSLRSRSTHSGTHTDNATALSNGCIQRRSLRSIVRTASH
jgi:hypothetical protein